MAQEPPMGRVEASAEHLFRLAQSALQNPGSASSSAFVPAMDDFHLLFNEGDVVQATAVCLLNPVNCAIFRLYPNLRGRLQQNQDTARPDVVWKYCCGGLDALISPCWNLRRYTPYKRTSSQRPNHPRQRVRQSQSRPSMASTAAASENTSLRAPCWMSRTQSPLREPHLAAPLTQHGTEISGGVNGPQSRYTRWLRSAGNPKLVSDDGTWRRTGAL